MNYFYMKICFEMKKIIILILAVCSLNNAISQESFVIDWAESFGGKLNERCFGVDVDAEGNYYLVGQFTDTVDFNPNGVAHILVSKNNLDGYIAKYNADRELVWVNQIGNQGEDNVVDVKLDQEGNVLIVGYVSDTVDLDPSVGEYIVNHKGSNDAIIVKYDAHGAFLWGGLIGGPDLDRANSLVIDNENHIHVTGYFKNTIDADLSLDDYPIVSHGREDGFIISYSAIGELISAYAVGGPANDRVYGCSIDLEEKLVITGYFGDSMDVNFSVPEEDYIYSNGSTDIFILKLETDKSLIWSQNFGGSGNDAGYDIDVDIDNAVLVTGSFRSTVSLFIDGITQEMISNGDQDIFVLKLNSAGEVLFTRATGGASTDQGIAITSNDFGDIFVTGGYRNTMNLNPSGGEEFVTAASGNDTYIFSLDVNGNYNWGLATGGLFYDIGTDLVVDENGDLYAVGYFRNAILGNYPSYEERISNSGQYDPYVMKIHGCNPIEMMISAEPSEICLGESYVLNGFSDELDVAFNWGVGISNGSAYTPASSGLNTHIVIAENSRGCQSISSVNTIVHALPFVDAGLHQTQCKGKEAIITATGAVSYEWTPAIENGVPFTVETVGDVTYTVIGTDENGCTDEDETVVKGIGYPSITAIITDEYTPFGGAIDITVSGGVGPYGYIWSHGPTTEDVDGLFEGAYHLIIDDTGVDDDVCPVVDSVFIIHSFLGNEKLLSDQIEIYPNPANNLLHINSIDGMSYIIHNQFGQIVLEGTVMNSQINISTLSAGVYMIELVGVNQLNAIKFIKI